MRALILFDGSATGYLSLQAACEDARRLYAAGTGGDAPPEPIEALLISMEITALSGFGGPLSRAGQAGPKYMLEHGVRELEQSGAFDRVAGEILVCQAANLTNVLQDRAKEWKATTIYIAVDEPVKGERQHSDQKQTGWRRVLGINPKPVLVSVQPTSPLTTTQVKVKQLMEQTTCKIVLVNAAGTAMRLSYFAPTSRKAAPALAAAPITRPGQPYAAR